MSVSKIIPKNKLQANDYHKLVSDEVREENIIKNHSDDDKHRSWFNKQRRREQRLKDNLEHNKELDNQINELSLDQHNDFKTYNDQAIVDHQIISDLTQDATTKELELVWNRFFVGKNVLLKINKIIDDISDNPDHDDLEIVNEITNSEYRGFNTGQLYLILSLLVSKLQGLNYRPKLIDTLIEYKENLANKCSGYLFEAFSFINLPELNSYLGMNNFNYLAEINDGKNMDIKSLTDALELVQRGFNGNMDKMVSIYMKLKANQLTIISAGELNNEGKVKITRLLRIEKYLHIILSIRDGLINYLATFSIKLDNKKFIDSVRNTIDFCRGSAILITFVRIKNLLNSWGVGDGHLNNYGNKLKNNLLRFFSYLPQNLFHAPTNQLDLVQKIKTIEFNVAAPVTNPERQDSILDQINDILKNTASHSSSRF